MDRYRVVLHVHTDRSHDSTIRPADLIAAVRREGIDWVAVTDHDAVEAALELARRPELRVIVGQEISSADGHILGLFLREAVPAGLSALETIAAVRAQGGLVVAPHPFCTLCPHSLGGAMDELGLLLDAVEVFNAQNPLPWDDWRAARFAARWGLPGCAGADVHRPGRIALCWQWMPAFDGPRSFLHGLRQAQLVRRRAGLRYWCATAAGAAREWWARRPQRPARAGMAGSAGAQEARRDPFRAHADA